MMWASPRLQSATHSGRLQIKLESSALRVPKNRGNAILESRNEATLFVGDLPPYFKNEDLETFFGQFGELEQVRVMGSQCYAFVTFQSLKVVNHIIDKYYQKPLTIAGHELRINKAHGQLPDWKVPPPPISSQPGR
jgi:RNA recognition motif-containing protein